MQSNQSPFASMYQAQLEVSRRCADAIFSGTEKMDQVMLDAAHHAVEEQLRLAEAMAEAGDRQSLSDTLPSDFLSEKSAEAANYQKQLVSIYTEMQAAIGRTLQEYATQVGSGGLPAKSRQRPEEASLGPVTDVFSMWEAAFRQASELARKNVEAARSAFEAAAEMATEGVADYRAAAGKLQSMGASLVPEASGKSQTGAAASRRRHASAKK